MAVPVDMSYALAQLRRRIKDNGVSQPEVYTDTLLIGLLSDAVDEVEMEWPRGIYVNPTTNEFSQTITNLDSALFTIRANILFASFMKEESDRTNLNFSKARLHIENIQQSRDHAMQLQRLEAEYARMMWAMYYRKVPGVLVQQGF